MPAETVEVSKGTTLVLVPDAVANTDTGSDRAANEFVLISTMGKKRLCAFGDFSMMLMAAH